MNRMQIDETIENLDEMIKKRLSMSFLLLCKFSPKRWHFFCFSPYLTSNGVFDISLLTTSWILFFQWRQNNFEKVAIIQETA